jgi:hypothetical protein
MITPRPTRWLRLALSITGVVNVIAGLASALAPALHGRMMFGPEVALDGLLLRYHLTMWLFVAAIGIGYLVAARDPARHWAMVVAGGIGKLAVAAVWIEMFVHGFGTPLLVVGAVFDGSLGVMFVLYVVWLRRTAAVAPAGLPGRHP